MAQQLSDEMVAEFREAFSLFGEGRAQGGGPGGRRGPGSAANTWRGDPQRLRALPDPAACHHAPADKDGEPEAAQGGAVKGRGGWEGPGGQPLRARRSQPAHPSDRCAARPLPPQAT